MGPTEAHATPTARTLEPLTVDALDLLSGDAQTFLEKVWASHVQVHHGRPSDYVDLLSFDDVDHLLTSTALRVPALRVAQNGHVLPAADFTRSATLAGVPLSGLVDARKTLDLYDGGATLVLQGLHRYWPPLTDLIRDLELSLGHPCQVNAYLTPPGSQGFARHSDSHDVFVFQTYGSKQWDVYDENGKRDVTLEPGVCMYMPTGTPHAARTQESASLHVTVGINRITWRQTLDRVIQQVLRNDAYDDAIPAGYVEDPVTFEAELVERLGDLSQALSAVDVRRAVETETTRFLTTRNSALRGGLSDRLAVQHLDDDTVLCRRAGAPCVIRPGIDGDGDTVRLLLGDRELSMPARLTQVLAYVRAHAVLRPRDLGAWLDPQSRLVLARRLVREGLLQVEA